MFIVCCGWHRGPCLRCRGPSSQPRYLRLLIIGRQGAADDGARRILFTAKTAPAGVPERLHVGVRSGTLPGCADPRHAFRWSFPYYPERPPATICQPSGLASVIVGKMVRITDGVESGQTWGTFVPSVSGSVCLAATGESGGKLASSRACCPTRSWVVPLALTPGSRTMNLPGRAPLPALSPRRGVRVAEGRERGGSWKGRDGDTAPYLQAREGLGKRALNGAASGG
jgi:hypothetical protein